MKNQKKYRDNGAVGALLDEYESALNDLTGTLKSVTKIELMHILDKDEKDENCLSIQTILTHVVRAGYAYASYVRQLQGEKLVIPDKILLNSIKEYQTALDDMFTFNVQLFTDYPNLAMEEQDNNKKILVHWGQLYDIEQLFEHAIVHILRHRRQIERFLSKIRQASYSTLGVSVSDNG